MTCPCPHCGEPSFTTPGHVCADRSPWTRAERDEWRAVARRVSPTIQFAPSSEQMAARFGERNRADAIASGRQRQA